MDLDKDSLKYMVRLTHCFIDHPYSMVLGTITQLNASMGRCQRIRTTHRRVAMVCTPSRLVAHHLHTVGTETNLGKI